MSAQTTPDAGFTRLTTEHWPAYQTPPQRVTIQPLTRSITLNYFKPVNVSMSNKPRSAGQMYTQILSHIRWGNTVGPLWVWLSKVLERTEAVDQTGAAVCRWCDQRVHVVSPTDWTSSQLNQVACSFTGRTVLTVSWRKHLCYVLCGRRGGCQVDMDKHNEIRCDGIKQLTVQIFVLFSLSFSLSLSWWRAELKMMLTWCCFLRSVPHLSFTAWL